MGAVLVVQGALSGHRSQSGVVQQTERWISHGEATVCESGALRDHARMLAKEVRNLVFAYSNQYQYQFHSLSTYSPESRPLFNVLERRFANMLGEDLANVSKDRLCLVQPKSLTILYAQQYLDLNDPYMRSNTEYMKNRPTDYLSLMGSPDEFAPTAPRYVNGHIVPDISE